MSCLKFSENEGPPMQCPTATWQIQPLPPCRGGALFNDDQVGKTEQRPMRTPGDLVYWLQRFFDDLINRYRTTAVASTIIGALHGGADHVVAADDRFVTCSISPGGGAPFMVLSNIYCKFFPPFHAIWYSNFWAGCEQPDMLPHCSRKCC